MAAVSALGWVCPDDGCALPLQAHALVCGGCGQSYAVRDGIPCFLQPERMDPRQQFEQTLRDRQIAPPENRRYCYERQVGIEAVRRRLPPEAAGLILDAGCGVGHLTHQLLERGHEICGLDFSLERLRYLKQHAPARGRLAVATADLNHIPLPPGSCAAVVNTQVLEHLPTAAARQQLLASFARLLRPGGTLIVTVYNFGEPWRRRGDPAEGVHASGIFYHCYQAPELQAELEAAGFEIIEICGIVHLMPHTYRLWPRLGALGRWCDHRIEAHPQLSQRWGNLLLAHARRPV